MSTALSQPKKGSHRRTKSTHIPKKEDSIKIKIENIIYDIKENEIESLYSKKDILEIKHKILIHRIREIRNKSALKIQNMWNKYKIRLKVHKLCHKVKGCYTVYPDAINACKMYIKIFTNELNKEEFKVLPLDFCAIRKCFVKDIPKNKFYTSKKTMYFNFIKNKKIFFDDKYEKVLYSNEYVQKVDFSQYDIRQKLLDETIYNKNDLFQKNRYISSSKDSTHLSTEDEKENSEISIFTPDKCSKTTKFSFNQNEINQIKEEDYDEYGGLRANKRRGTDESIKNKDIKIPIKIDKHIRKYKKCESFDISNTFKTKLISILKASNREELHKRKLQTESGKKVTFGDNVYFY